MMKIKVVSDLHLEFGTIEITNKENAKVLILSGDICVAKELTDRDDFNINGMSNKSNIYHDFFQTCCSNFEHVIYVAGNHEHYHGDYANTISHLKDKLGYLKNLNILDKEYVAIDDITFIGGTLWTDMNKEDPHTLYSIKSYMNDYRIIEDSSRTVSRKVPIYKKDETGQVILDEKNFQIIDHYEHRDYAAKFTPETSVEDHKAMLAFIDKVTADMPREKFVVVGHHAPSKLSTKPEYKDDKIVNGAYSSDLSEFILDRPQIKMWTHGHTHDEFDYMIGSTRIVCNPRGYIKYEHRADVFNPDIIFEV